MSENMRRLREKVQDVGGGGWGGGRRGLELGANIISLAQLSKSPSRVPQVRNLASLTLAMPSGGYSTYPGEI